MSILVALLVALAVGGIVLVVAGVTSPAPEPRDGTRRGLAQRLPGLLERARASGWRVVLGVAAGVAIAVATGWPVLAVLVPPGVIGLPLLLGTPPNREVELLQALDRWVRSLTATLPTGRSITDAIRVSERQAPALLAPALQLLIARLDDRWTPKQAIFAMADELDSPDADAVLAALALAAERGGTGATGTLAALADSIQDRLRALREIETERSKPRAVVKQVTVITATVLGAAMLFGREFFAPYGRPLGQLVLAVLLAAYVGSLVMLRRMTLPRRRERIIGVAR